MSEKETKQETLLLLNGGFLTIFFSLKLLIFLFLLLLSFYNFCSSSFTSILHSSAHPTLHFSDILFFLNLELDNTNLSTHAREVKKSLVARVTKLKMAMEPKEAEYEFGPSVSVPKIIFNIDCCC